MTNPLFSCQDEGLGSPRPDAAHAARNLRNCIPGSLEGYAGMTPEPASPDAPRIRGDRSGSVGVTIEVTPSPDVVAIRAGGSYWLKPAAPTTPNRPSAPVTKQVRPLPPAVPDERVVPAARQLDGGILRGRVVRKEAGELRSFQSPKAHD